MSTLALVAAAAGFSVVAPGAGFSAPFVPRDDAQILERLRDSPTDPAARELKQLRGQLGREPRNLGLAVIVARRYIERMRAEADPRYLGYAQAALAPWWDLAQPPPVVRVLRATIRQAVHDFEAALFDLSQVLEVQPNNAQAWLTRATILQVRGEYAEARKNCERLSRLTDELIFVACLTGVTSLNGEAARSYASLRQVFERKPERSNAEKIWILTSLAEMAQRLGYDEVAEGHFKTALALGAPDSYLKGAYADFLLDRGRPSEVVVLLKGETRADSLLLRLALADKALNAPTLGERVAALASRFRASRMRGDAVHLRDEVRFTLRLLNDPARAVKLARDNWAAQREPWDARLVLESALAANDPGAAEPVLRWLGENRLEDVTLADLAARLARVQR